jgi:hypothetical protein
MGGHFCNENPNNWNNYYNKDLHIANLQWINAALNIVRNWVHWFSITLNFFNKLYFRIYILVQIKIKYSVKDVIKLLQKI